MSQMAPEAPATSQPSRPGGGTSGNVFKRRIGPLPMWVWLAIGVGAIGLYVLYRSRSGGTASGSPGATTSAATVPQFVNQTYTTVTPPVANPAVSSPTPVPVGLKTLEVTKNQTLAQFAKEHHWTTTTLAAVEKLNNLKPGSRLKKGQKIKRPLSPFEVAQPGGVSGG